MPHPHVLLVPTYRNTYNVLTTKFHCRSSHSSNFSTNLVNRDRLSLNLPCYTLIRRKQHMRVLRFLKLNCVVDLLPKSRTNVKYPLYDYIDCLFVYKLLNGTLNCPQLWSLIDLIAFSLLS